MTSPIPLTSDEDVAAYLALAEDGPLADRTYLAETAAAVSAAVAGWFDPPANGAPWPKNLAHGATMLAARVWRRRNTPSGVEAFGELGPVYVQRNDPDIAILLGLGNYMRPAVG